MGSGLSIDADEIIRGYAGFRHHRSGSSEDRATCDWLTRQLTAVGLETTRIDYEFPRYEAQWQCRVNSIQIDSIPLFYSAAGEFEFESLEVIPLKLNDWSESEMLERIAELAEQQKATGKPALVLATESVNGAVYAINVGVEFNLDFPVLLVGPDSAPAGSRVSGSLKANVVDSSSAGLLAMNKSEGSPDLIITTAFSGWFSCASERAAGIAVMLELISRLRGQFKLTVITASGHELHHLGIEAVQEQTSIDPAIPVLHIGSCVGVSDAELVFSTNFSIDSNEKLSAVMNRIGARVVQRNNNDIDDWPGESRNWVNARRAVLSLVGVDANFHTPLDKADNINLDAMPDIVDALEFALATLLPVK